MLKEILTSRSRKFLLSVGDEGAVLVYMVKGKVEARFFFNNSTAPEIEKVFLSDKIARIFVLVDVSDQSYLQHSLPPVSALNVNKMAARRLEKEFERTDIKGALLLNRSKTGRKDWNFIFASIRNVPPLSDWLAMLSDLPNEVAGIYLLPIETEPFVKAIKKAVETENTAQASEWQMLVTHNKTGGLRQVVYRNERILFTRMAQPVGGNAPGVIAGHIEQETLNTMEYIRRMNFEEKSGLDIFIITAAEVKKQLEATRLKAANTYVLTPHEVAGLLGFDKATEPRDKFADVVMLVQFGKAKKAILKLTTPLLKKTQHMVWGKLALQISTAVLIPIALLLTIFNIYTSVGVSRKITDQQTLLTRAQSDQHALQQRADAQAAHKAEVEAMVTLYDQFSQDAFVPFVFLNKISELKGPIALYENLYFNVTEVSDPITKKSANSLSFSASVDYPNHAVNLQAYLKEVGEFAQRIRDAFKSLKVEFNGLPGQTDFTLSVAGGPTVAGAAPIKPPSTAPEKRAIQLNISGKINDETHTSFFEMPKKEEKKITLTPLQTPTFKPMEHRP